MPVDIVRAEMEELVDPHVATEWLADGFGGATRDGLRMGVAEGPVWSDAGYLLFTDSAYDRRYRWTEAGGVEIDREPTNEANGQAFDPQGRLIACEHRSRRVTREEADGSITVVADDYRGWRLNRPPTRSSSARVP